ncbi:MAG: hypothetical protein HZB41_12225 [Ignavibacteriae bacterium]|nr:hypothetical protein [Ignavibacteriota bacterium]
MKKIFHIVIAFFSLLLFQSCSDIINSDDNIKKYDIHYNYVLSDQTKSVIMPLHEGNNWIFNVKELKNGNIEKEYFDTIRVINKIILNNETWFEVKWTNSYSNTLYMTNTDIGLWMKCNICDNKSTLEAQYPSKSSPYFACKYDDMKTIIYNDSLDEYELLTFEFYRWTNIENFTNGTILAGSFNGLKFSSNMEDKNTNVQFSLSYISYFVPDLGPIKFDNYILGTKFEPSNLNLSYELISYKLYE